MKVTKKTNKNNHQKSLIWFKTISVLSTATAVVAPIAIMYSYVWSVHDTSLDPTYIHAYEVKPTDANIAYVQIDDKVAIGLKVVSGYDKKSIVIKKENITYWGGVSGFMPGTPYGSPTISMDYLEYGESIIDNSSTDSNVGVRMFTSLTKVTDATIVIRNQVGTKGEHGLIFESNSFILHNNRAIYLDIDLENVTRLTPTDLPFLAGDVPTIKIYINQKRGDRVGDWAKLLNTDSKYITPIWPRY